jgi:hypothetical protein
MALIIDRTGLELSAGPFSFHLTGSLVGLAWDKKIDAMLEWGRGLSEGWRPSVWSDGPGRYVASLPGLRLSVMLGAGQASRTFAELLAEVRGA